MTVVRQRAVRPYAVPPSRAVRPCSLSHPESQRLAQQQPLRCVAACARGCNCPITTVPDVWISLRLAAI